MFSPSFHFCLPLRGKCGKHSAIAGVLPDTPYVRNYLTQLVILFLYLCYSPFLCVSSVVTFPCQCFSRLALVFALLFTVSPSLNTSFPPPSPFPDIVVLFFHGPWNRVICWMFPLHSILRRNCCPRAPNCAMHIKLDQRGAFQRAGPLRERSQIRRLRQREDRQRWIKRTKVMWLLWNAPREFPEGLHLTICSSFNECVMYLLLASLCLYKLVIKLDAEKCGQFMSFTSFCFCKHPNMHIVLPYICWLTCFHAEDTLLNFYVHTYFV